jgi:membrane-bound lytic murein transglycosylase MltF
VAKPFTGDFDEMVERRLLRVLVAPSKSYYFVENGQQRGATYESFAALGEALNKKLQTGHVKFQVVFIPVSRAELVPALVAGRGDVAASGITITPERETQVDFTRPTWEGISEIVVTGPASPALASLDDLAGREIFVRRSSSYWEHVETLSRKLEAAGKAPIRLVEAPEDLEDEDLFELLNAGAFEIGVADAPIAKLWATIYTGLKPREDLAVHEGGQFAWMIRKGSPKLKAELDAFIATHGQGTAFGNTVAKRYGKSTRFLQGSTSPDEMRKFRTMVDLFKKYSGQYDVDPLLAMAQGYQESRLDQDVRSHVGAIGVMQVMPATGKELATGDITQLEPNIHAGVKYIRFMIDRYFADQPMTEVNKMLFAFAAYNCGPGRLAKLRKEAAERGLDPNRWFNHVELVAADRIGAETPTYVGNIYKYYIAYKLVADREAAKEKAKSAVANS